MSLEGNTAPNACVNVTLPWRIRLARYRVTRKEEKKDGKFRSKGQCRDTFRLYWDKVGVPRMGFQCLWPIESKIDGESCMSQSASGRWPRYHMHKPSRLPATYHMKSNGDTKVNAGKGW